MRVGFVNTKQQAASSDKNFERDVILIQIIANLARQVKEDRLTFNAISSLNNNHIAKKSSRDILRFVNQEVTSRRTKIKKRFRDEESTGTQKVKVPQTKPNFDG